MAWFKVDDAIAFHPKVMDAGDAAMGLWMRAGAWSMQQLTDGYIPDNLLKTLGARPAQVASLVRAGLWLRVAGGHVFHEWEQHQPTRDEVRAARKANAGRQQRFRDRRADGARNAVTNGVTNDVSNSTPARPGPARPQESTLGGELTGGGTNASPPLYAFRCAAHGHVASPPPCGACADVRKAAAVAPRLTVVPPAPAQRCLVHAEPDVETCRGCAADAKAAPDS